MPNFHERERLRKALTLVKLVERNEKLTFKRTDNAYIFEAQRKQSQELGEMLLYGIRDFKRQNLVGQKGIIIQNGFPIGKDIQEIFEEMKDPYSLRIALYPGARESTNYDMVCTLHIDEAALWKSVMHSYDFGTENSRWETEASWQILEGTEKFQIIFGLERNIPYEVFESSNNTGTLARYSFSFSMVPKTQ